MLFRQIKRTIFFFLICYSAFISAQTTAFVGSYTHSEMEFAEQMHILASHRFSWQQVYGASDIDLRGQWMSKGDTLIATLDPIPDNKNPGQLEAVLTSSGDLSLVKFNDERALKPHILKRSEYRLSQEAAEELEQSIDYSKVTASRKSPLESQEEKEQNRFEKFDKEREQFGKYHGFFKSDDTDAPVILGMNAKRKQFVVKKPAAEKGAVNYFQGTFSVKNDTAYATTTAAQDAIRLYGTHSDAVADQQLVIYFRNLDPKIIRVKTGKGFDESTFIASEKFKTENDSVYSLQVKQGDTLWIAIGQQEGHSYSFSLQDTHYNQLLVQPNYAPVVTWVEKPIYITDEDEIDSLFDGQISLKRAATERMYPSLPMMPSNPRFKGTRYFPINREQLFKLPKE